MKSPQSVAVPTVKGFEVAKKHFIRARKGGLKKTDAPASKSLGGGMTSPPAPL